MMKPRITIGAGLIDPYKLGCATLVACLLVPLLFLSALRTNLQGLPTVNLQVWISRKAAEADHEGVVGVDGGKISNSSRSGITDVGAAAAAVQEHPEATPSLGRTSNAIPVRDEDGGTKTATSRLPTLFPETLPLQPDSTVLDVSPEAGERKSNSTVLVVPPEAGEHKSNSTVSDGSPEDGEHKSNSTVLDVSAKAAEAKPIPDESSPTIQIPTTVELRESTSAASQSQKLPQSDGTSSVNFSTTDVNTRKESGPQQSGDQSAPQRTDSVQDDGVKETEQSKMECDFSQVRTNICQMHGDVRVHGPSSTVKLVAAPEHVITNPIDQNSSTSSWKIRPYPRKWEGSGTLSLVKELTLSMSPPEADNNNIRYRCSLHHIAPAVVFSTGGFQGNFFHDLADVMIPLFLTTTKYGGEVQFLIVNFKPQWVQRYKPLLNRLSRYEVINLDADDRVHCFRDVTVGLKSNKELGIDSEKAPEGPSMLDFRQFLRRSFGLKRDFVLTPPKLLEGSARKPTRMVIVSRTKSRVLINERQVVRMARRLGYKVVVAGLQQMKNLTEMAKIVNSCDVLLGVHGAGLTNMVFLPTNATMIQIIPWGDMTYPCRFSYGDPAVAMGLRYIEYEIGKKETSLTKRYPKDHPVFTNPISIHKQGFVAIWSTFLSQDVTVDLGKFQGILQQALRSS